MRLDTMLGPLISARQKARVSAYLGYGVADGAALRFGGDDMPGPGHFIRPAMFTEVRADMRIAREEIFGPILSVIRFSDEDRLIRALMACAMVSPARSGPRISSARCAWRAASIPGRWRSTITAR
jgi:acyl-CoA reductase-like NAD-dependent aldehyde dehydrogenase